MDAREKKGESRATECDRVIQYASFLCVEGPSASWLTGVRKRMCCNSPWGSIPPWSCPALDPGILAWRQESGFSRKSKTLNRSIFPEIRNKPSFFSSVSFSMACTMWERHGRCCSYHRVDKDSPWVGKTHACTEKPDWGTRINAHSSTGMKRSTDTHVQTNMAPKP